LLSRGITTDNIEFYRIPTDWCWCRDTGPMFALGPRGLTILDWIFNAWGNPSWPHSKDTVLPERVAQALGLDCVRLSLVAEGGAMEFNGAGAMIASEPCFRHRNPSTAKAEMDRFLKSRMLQSMTQICRSAGLSFPAASVGMGLLVELDIARELTGKRRNRLYVYDRYLTILSEGTEAV
jgi:agmatine/peptidylarginine deiminase